MYKYFGINIKEQKVNNVPGTLKELLEQHPELWSKITDIKFEDGTTVHQRNGKFNNYEYENAEKYRRTLEYDYSVNDENYSCYSVKFNDIEKGNGPEKEYDYFKTSMSFIDGKLQSTKPLDENYKEIRDVELPSIILKNGKSYVECMTFMWHNKGKLHSFRNIPSIIKNKLAYSVFSSNKPVTCELQYHKNGIIDKHFDFYSLEYKNCSRESYRYLYNILTNIQNFQKQYIENIEYEENDLLNEQYDENDFLNNSFFNIEDIQNEHHGLGSNLKSYVQYCNGETCEKKINNIRRVIGIRNAFCRNICKLKSESFINDKEIIYKNVKCELHREDGPARIVKNYKDNTISCEYYLNDIEYSSYEEIKEELKRRVFQQEQESKKNQEESMLYEALYL